MMARIYGITTTLQCVRGLPYLHDLLFYRGKVLLLPRVRVVDVTEHQQGLGKALADTLNLGVGHGSLREHVGEAARRDVAEAHLQRGDEPVRAYPGGDCRERSLLAQPALIESRETPAELRGGVLAHRLEAAA